MHLWTKKVFIERCINICNSEGYAPNERLQSVFEWASGLVEQAYNDGYEAGKKATIHTFISN